MRGVHAAGGVHCYAGQHQNLASQEIHAVHPSPRQVPAKVTGFIEWLQGEFGETWWSDPQRPQTAKVRSRLVLLAEKLLPVNV